jgi:uncharacterized protein (TIGR03435 family)
VADGVPCRIGIVLIASLGLLYSAQFEAVSIKRNKSGSDFVSIQPSPGGRLTATNVTVANLIAWAYVVRTSEIENAPAWADSEGYDVAAEAEGNPRFDAFQPTLETMFRSVLAERCKLILHRETKQLPVYSLVIAKRGSKMHQLAGNGSDCLEHPNPENPCGQIRLPQPGQLTARRANISALVFVLSRLLDRPVIDQTGLTGSYDFDLKWPLEPLVRPPSSAGPAPIPDRESIAAAMAPAVATAMEEQLGLELQSSKGPVEILVIDHLERPSEN